MGDYQFHDNTRNETANHKSAFVDPLYWNPKCKGFQLMDWEKWESLNPTVPKIFDPPQRYGYLRELRSIPLWWWNRSCYFRPCAPCVRKKPESARISDDSQVLIKKLLKPSPNPDVVPEALRNKLFWTENNVAPETLVSFNRWAWRPQSKEGRVIGLGNLKYDWTNDPTCWGGLFTHFLENRFATVQMSPDGKWIVLTSFDDPGIEGKVSYIHIYVVQTGDEFKTPDGKIIDYVKPGDIVRISWDSNDPYACGDNPNYMYFPRAVATLKNGVAVRNEEHYGDLLKRATNDPDKCVETCGYCCSFGMSGEDRFDFQVNNVSDEQIFASSPDPPTSEKIDRL